MKKIMAIALTVAMLLTCIIAMPVSAANTTSANLVANGDMSAATNGAPTGWTAGATGTKVTDNAVSGFTAKNDGSGDYYGWVVPEKRADGKNSGAAGVVSVPHLYTADATPYIVTIRYRTIGTQGAYVKISDINNAWKGVIDECLPVTDADATTLEEADWGTFTKFLYIEDNANTAQARLDIALRAHPNASVGAHYDSISIVKVDVSEENYIVNGDFEMSNVDDTNILGWTQLDAGSLTKVVSDRGGKAVSGGVGLKTFVPMQYGMRTKNIYLSFVSQYGGGGGMPAVTVTAHTTSGDVSYKYSSFIDLGEEAVRGSGEQSYKDGLSWGYAAVGKWLEEPVVINLENLITLAGGRDAIKGFTFIFANSTTKAGAYDDIKLYAKGNIDGNLINNGSFEADAIGSTTITGWEQVGTTNMTVKGQDRTYLVPFADGGANLVHNNGASGLKQTITLDKTAAWYTDQDNYSFIISGSAYATNINMLGEVTITPYDANGNSFSQVFDLRDIAITTTWTMNNFSIDFSHVMDFVPGTVEKIDVQIAAITKGADFGFDGIKVLPTYNPTRKRAYPLNVVNSGFEADEVGSTEITGWTSDGNWKVAARDLSSGKGAQGEKLLEAPGTCGRISQMIEIDTTADYYANPLDYDWYITYRGRYITYAYITGYNSDKTVKGTEVTHSTFDKRADFTTVTMAPMDISSAISSVGKAKYLEVAFGPHAAKESVMLDSVMLYAIKKDVDPNAPVSIIKNGGFENVDAEGNITDWDCSYRSTLGLGGRYNNVDFAPAGYALAKLVSKYETNEAGENVAGPYGGIMKQRVSLVEGKYYTVTFMYNSADAGAALIQFTDVNGVEKFGQRFAATAGTWATKTVVFKAPYTGEYDFCLRCHPDTAEVYYENVTMYEYAVDESALTKEGNLLVNGSFEQDLVGAASIIGWNISGYDASMIINHDRARDGQKVMSHHFDTVSQKVDITEYDTANASNYGYTLEFSYGSYNGGNLGIKFDLEFEDASQNQSITFSDFRAKAHGGEANAPDGITNGDGVVYDPLKQFPHKVLNSTPADIAIDLTAYTTKTTSPLKSITVNLTPGGTACYLDDFKLYKNSNRNIVEIVGADGVAVADVVTGEATYKAKVKYYGAEDATAYLAVYTKGADGMLRLANVTNATVTKGVGTENSDAVLTGVNATAGSTIVKAFIWGTELNPIASTTID